MRHLGDYAFNVLAAEPTEYQARIWQTSPALELRSKGDQSKNR